jgi:hypothetical protein
VNPALHEFERYLTQLSDACRAHPAITGLVLMGSTADRFRVDEWSDHDFAVVCNEGAQESLRGDLSWLPCHDSLAFVAREHHDGFKGAYQNGAVIEFAVVDRDQLATFHANAWEVAYDEIGDLTELMRRVAARRKPSDEIDVRRDFDVFLASLLIGVGRARRGELLSASSIVRGQAVDHLVSVILGLDGGDPRADNLDGRRRFEQVHPGAVLGETLDTDLENSARNLLLRAESLLGLRWPAYPADHVAVVRGRLGWPR